MKKMNKAFWEERYAQNALGWDIGYPSPPLTAYIDQLADKNLRILVPGAGFGHEVAYLWQQGFTEVVALDIAAAPLERLKARLPEAGRQRLRQQDFFELEGLEFDLILEQTFFCALPPVKRQDYAKKMHELLVPGGKLVGLLFDFPLTGDGPPFGGSKQEYENLFSPFFQIRVLERAYNSIPPRMGNELFFIFEK